MSSSLDDIEIRIGKRHSELNAQATLQQTAAGGITVLIRPICMTEDDYRTLTGVVNSAITRMRERNYGG